MQKTFLSDLSLFWTLQIVGWSGYMLDRYLSAEGRFFPVYFIYLVIACALTFALRPVYRKIWRRKPTVLTVGLAIIVCSIVAAYLWLIFGEIVFALVGIRKFPVPEKQSLTAYLSDTFIGSLQHHKPFLFLSWSALYFGIKYWQGKREEEENALKAEALAKEAELKMLRYQLNPHFLFNSLNSASALISENPPRAERMINELSDFLRYSLADTKTETVRLRDEIEALKNYLNIEQVRFEEKLQVGFNIAPETENFRLPVFLLHPLVENAVKYGMQTSELPLKIEIKAETKNNRLSIEISNSGKWYSSNGANPQSSGMRVGMENVRKRLEQFFPNRYRFHTFERHNRVHVLLEIEK
ncbi:MAG TPA: histidine kinase [Pyrinomonadaceae bacterium]|jgi:two-component sensor histidine kinase